MGVAEQQRGAAHGVVDIFPALDVPLLRALGSVRIGRIGRREACLVGDSAGQRPACLLEELFRRQTGEIRTLWHIFPPKYEPPWRLHIRICHCRSHGQCGTLPYGGSSAGAVRSEERRVGKEWVST